MLHLRLQLRLTVLLQRATQLLQRHRVQPQQQVM
jgi:hypothetical protein